MKKVLFLITVFVFLLFGNSFAQSDFNSTEFKKYVNGELKKWQVPGCSVLIIRDDKVVFKDGFGLRDIKKRLPVNSATIFPIGSCSKAFTAFSTALLVDEGKIDLDKPARTYYPELQLYDPYVTEAVTPRDLLCHRTGIPGYDALWFQSKLTRQQLMERMKYLKPNKGFRDVFQYNNLTFVLAGVLVEKASGKSWEEFVKERVFIPLGMSMTNTDNEKSMQSGNYSKPYAHGSPIVNESRDKTYYCAPFEIPFHEISSVGPAGSINSNLDDLEKWVRLYINKGKIGDKQFISPQSFEQIVYPQIPAGRNFSGRLDIMSPASYCLGWGSLTYKGNYTLSHAGSIDGFTSMIMIVPGKKTAVVVLTNTFRNNFANIIAFDALDRALGVKPEDWSGMYRKSQLAGIKTAEENSRKVESERKKNTKPSHALKEYNGKYVHPAFGDCIIRENDGKLCMEAEGTLIPLEHWHYDTFTIKGLTMPDGSKLLFSFDMNNKGDIITLTMPLEAGTDPIVFEKEVK